LSVIGGVIPDDVKSDPTMERLEITTGAVPVEESVTFCDTTCPTLIAPKLTLVELTVSVGTTALSCRFRLLETPPPVPVSTAVWAAVTAETAAAKPAETALAATVTDAGRVTADELLASATATPPVGATELRVTMQVSVPDPVNAEFAHEIALKVLETPATPAALMLTTIFPLDELLAIVSTPVKVLTCGETNWSVKLAVWPGFRVNGKVIPEAENSDPTTERLEIVTGALPVELRVIDCVTV
jgi:hypothetical protein